MKLRLLLVLLLPPAAGYAALAPVEEKISAAVDAHAHTFATDLEAAVQIDSATENLAGVRQIGAYFGTQLAALGFDTSFVELPASTGRAGHIIATRKGNRGQRVLLLGHLDTVLPGGNFRREGDKAFGSGTCDIKGGNLVIIHALRALHAARALDGAQITVIMTGDEEAVGQPMVECRRVLFDAAQTHDMALGFEGAIGDTATVARRGSLSWELETQGATGHSSGIFSTAMGAGSVFEAARILNEFYDEIRTLEGVTLNPAMITGGTEATLTRTGGTATGKSNITAQHTLVRGDLRTMSAAQLSEARARMQAIVDRHLPRTSATITFNEGYPAMPETPANHALLRQLDVVSRDLGYAAITAFDPKGRGAGDIAFVSPPLPGLDGLGVRGRGAHAPNESADLATVPEMVKRTAILIYRLTQ